MTLEPAAHQLVEARFIAKTPARAMHRHKAAAVLHILFQVRPLMRLDRTVVRVQQQHVKLAEILRIAQRLLDAHRVIKINRIPPQRLGEHGVVLVGVMMLRRMPQKQHANRPGLHKQEAEQHKNSNEQAMFHDRLGLIYFLFRTGAALVLGSHLASRALTAASSGRAARLVNSSGSD